jgi:hypothetical protein
MRLVIKNSIQLCLRTLVFSIVLMHSNYNNRIISIQGTFSVLGTDHLIFHGGGGRIFESARFFFGPHRLRTIIFYRILPRARYFFTFLL